MPSRSMTARERRLVAEVKDTISGSARVPNPWPSANPAASVKREVADRGKVIQVEEAVACCCQIELGVAQVLVLRFKFDLVNPQLMRQCFGVVQACPI